MTVLPRTNQQPGEFEVKSEASFSKRTDAHRARPWWWNLALTISLILLIIWIFRLSKSDKSNTDSASETRNVEPLREIAASVTATNDPSLTSSSGARRVPTQPAILFDSNRISGGLLFSKSRDDKFVPDSDAPSGWSLWAGDASGAERLVHESVFSARFSPDGRRIAYTTSGCTLRVEDLEGNKLAEVEGGYSPQWKPDGRSVVFAKVPQGHDLYLPGTLHLATLDPASGQVNLLTDGRFDDGRPEYAPSGDWILFVSGARNGFASFWKVDSNGSEPVQVTNIGQHAVDETFVPTPYRKTLWSPDGRWFIYDFKNGEREQIWGLQFAANGELTRASKLTDGLDPVWSREGKTFVFSKRVNGQAETAMATLP